MFLAKARLEAPFGTSLSKKNNRKAQLMRGKQVRTQEVIGMLIGIDLYRPRHYELVAPLIKVDGASVRTVE